MCIGGLVLITQRFTVNDDVEISEPLIQLTESTPEHRVDIQASEVSNEEPLSLRPVTVTEPTCMPAEVINDPIFSDWVFTNVGYGEMDAENYMDMPTLLEQAEASNSYAMFVLASHHYYRAQRVGEYDPGMRPGYQPKGGIKPKPLDVIELDKAEYWFLQAAHNGVLGGFIELSRIYADKWLYARKQSDVSESDSRALVIKAQAYAVFAHFLLPEYFKLLPHEDPNSFPEERRDQFDIVLEEVKNQWKKRREALGLPIELNLEVPKALIIYAGMEVCKD